MERLAKTLFKVIFLALFFLTIWVTCSCSTKKKFVEKQAFKVERAQEKSLNAIVKNDIAIKELETGTLEKTHSSTGTKFSGELANPDIPAKVVKEEKDGKTYWTFTGFKNVTTDEISEWEKSKEEISKDVSFFDKSITDLTLKEQLDETETSKSRIVDLKTKRTNTFISIGIGLGILACMILLFLFIYFRIKRGKKPVDATVTR